MATRKTDVPGVTLEENLTPAQKAARTRAANKAAREALAAAPAATVEDVTEVVDNITDAINDAAADDAFIAVVQQGTPNIPARVRNVLYTAGVVLGSLGVVVGPFLVLLSGDAKDLATSVVGAGLALSNLLAKANLSRTAQDIEAEKAVG